MPQPEDDHSTDGGTPAKKPRRKKAESPPVDTGPTCGQCKHWVAGEDGDGLCHRYPPKMQIDEEGYFLYRPIVDVAEKACGEFRGAN